MSSAKTTASPPPEGGQRRSPLLRRVLRAGWRTLDGALLLGLGWLARCWPRGKGGRGVVLVTNTMAVGGVQQDIVTWLRHGAHPYRPIRLLLLTAVTHPLVDLDSLGVPVEVVEELVGARPWRRWLLEALPRTVYVWILWQRLRLYRPAVVWSRLLLANAVAAPAARLAGVPHLICSEYGLSGWKYRRAGGLWWYRPAERTAAALSDVVVVNAQALVQDYACWLGWPPERIAVIVNGIDPARWTGGPKSKQTADVARQGGQLIVLSVGRLCPEKAQAMLIRVSARLLEAGLHHRLVLVGGGELAEELKQMVRELGMEETVLLAGEVRDPSTFYREADVFALSSVAEGMPNVLIEAQLCGLPVVTTDAGGAGEVVVDGETGFVVPVRDEAAFAAALRRLLEDPELRRRMGEAGRRRVLEVFSVERMVREVDQLLAALGVAGASRG